MLALHRKCKIAVSSFVPGKCQGANEKTAVAHGLARPLTVVGQHPFSRNSLRNDKKICSASSNLSNALAGSVAFCAFLMVFESNILNYGFLFFCSFLMGF